MKRWSGWSTTRGELLSIGELNESGGKSKKLNKRSHAHGIFTCTTCSRTYIRKDSLQRHILWECGKEPKFQCPFCPQKCKRKSHHIRHIQRQHRDVVDLLNRKNVDFSVKSS